MRTWNPLVSLRNAYRNAPWIVMAIAIHVIVLVVLGVWQLGKDKSPQVADAITIGVRPSVEEPPVEPVVPPEPTPRMLIPKNTNNELVTFEEDFDLPTRPDVPEDLSADVGDPDSLADTSMDRPGGASAIGITGPGRRSKGPSGVGGPGGGFLKRGIPKGETDGTYRHVLEGLRWLARHQNPDGSWSAPTLKDRCSAESPCFDVKERYHELYDEGTTALALLAFLGAGYSHESKQTIVDTVRAKRHVVGEVIKNGLQWLARRQQPSGQFSKDKAYMYNEALATMALAEAYGLTQNRYWKEPAQKGVDFLQRAQRSNPTGQGLWGWRYESREDVEALRSTSTDPAESRLVFDADTSVTTWCVMALKSAQLSGLSVKKESMSGALEFVKWASADNGLVGYTDPKVAGSKLTGKNDHFQYHTATMSALGMCTRIFVAHDASDPLLELAAKQITSDLPSVSKDKLSIDYYYWYYASLALNQFDGPDSPRKGAKYWGPWNKAMVEAVISQQNTEERSCHRGGWLTADRWAYTGGPVYTTAINVLTLEVYYRYENAFGGAKRN